MWFPKSYIAIQSWIKVLNSIQFLFFWEVSCTVHRANPELSLLLDSHFEVFKLSSKSVQRQATYYEKGGTIDVCVSSGGKGQLPKLFHCTPPELTLNQRSVRGVEVAKARLAAKPICAKRNVYCSVYVLNCFTFPVHTSLMAKSFRKQMRQM